TRQTVASEAAAMHLPISHHHGAFDGLTSVSIQHLGVRGIRTQGAAKHCRTAGQRQSHSESEKIYRCPLFHPPTAGWVTVADSRCPGRVVRQAMNAAQSKMNAANRKGAPGIPQAA